ncbi:exosome complex component RRP46 [Diaphorina citri]|uniref:Exosome complex component RRP46 n=1 Tax=Diaphorina citri TaxID=121845 RepID=A0A1S4ETA0_DIACI|nr:exosome complex component RRP46 [Diaphorina citri]
MDSLRELKSQLNILSRSDGSVIFSQGQTVVVASMYGPVEAKIQKTIIDKASVEVIFRPKSGLSFVQDRLKESVIKSTCESALLTMLHPRTSVILTIQELQDQGSLLSCCINAACLALINSGISMRYILAAVSCIINDKNEVILDANQIQSNVSINLL